MNRERAPPPPPPAPGQMPRGQGMMPGMMPGQQRPPQFQGPPPQQFNPQQQHFQGPPQQLRPIIHQDSGPRYPADQPLNGLATIHCIVPAKQKTEKDFRKELTVYEVYKISPTKNSAKDKKDTTKKDKTDKKDKKTTESRGSWTEAITVQQFFDKKDIEATIKKLDAKDSATKKMKELGPNQTTQISYILDNKILQDRDPQFEWIVAQLERDFYPADKNGKKFTRSITIYLKRSPKDNVDCMDLVQRRQMQERQHQENQRMLQQQQQQAQQQQHQIRMHQAQQEHAVRVNQPRMNIPAPKGLGGSQPGVRKVGGRGSSPAGVPIVETSDSDGKSNSSDSDTNSDSGSDSETVPSSTSSSRSGRNRKDKQYYGRGNTHGGRSRSRNRNREKDYTLVASRRHADFRARGLPRVPESPRYARDRSRSRPRLPPSTTYHGRPSVEVHERTSPHFFEESHSSIVQQPPILHQSHRDSLAAAAAVNQDALADMLAKGLEMGLKAAQRNRDEHVRADALTLTRVPRPPMPHSHGSDLLDYRTRQAELRAEEIQLQDELDIERFREARARHRSPYRAPRDMDLSRRFNPADLRDRTPMSPSIMSGSSSSSYAPRGRNTYAHDPRDAYSYRRRAGSPMGSDSDRAEYDFMSDFEGRDDRNPFQYRPDLQQRARTPSRPAFGRANSMRAPPYPPSYR